MTWNTYADDLADLVEKLDLKDAAHVGHSTGGGEVARYIGRHGNKRVVKTVLISAVPPIMVKSAGKPGALPIEVFDRSARMPSAERGQERRPAVHKNSEPFRGRTHRERHQA